MKHRWMLPAGKYGVLAEGGTQARLRLLQDFGGLSQGYGCLNEVPSEAFLSAVERFSDHFGLEKAEELPW